MRRIVFLVALTAAIGAMGIAATAATARTHSRSWHPAARGGLDCNGWSPVQQTFRQLWCTEIASNSPHGFIDNGWYVGHDEPDLGFFSSLPGSSDNMTYHVVLPTDPALPPSPNFGGITHEFQLTPAIWFGMVMCDNQSYPEGTKVCHPDSDANIQVPPRADHAGAAYEELQMYPPGFVGSSCDPTRWCAALNVDSLQGQFGALHGPGDKPGAIANPNCTEPINFAFLTHSGIPGGPPGPDQQTAATFTPTPDTLMMNSGDTLNVTLRDTPEGLFTEISDVTNGQTGFMVAGVRSGFRHIIFDPVHLTCKGEPYAFHPMYNTAAAPLASGQPTAWTTWSAHTDNVAYDAEIGHFEPADRASDVSAGVFGDEDRPCFDAPPIPGCTGSDSDFDGFPYHPDWPSGSRDFPTPNYFTSPRTPAGNGIYPIARFETDLPRIEEANNLGGLNCNHHTGQGCTNPPPGAFYPWFHLLTPPSGTGCAWALTNDGVPGTISNFGGEQAGWGPIELTDYGFDKRFHNFANRIANPCP